GSRGCCWHSGSSGCGWRRVRLESPQKLGGPLLVHDHGHEVLVIPDRPKATVRIAIHAEHRCLLLRLGRRTRVLRTVVWLLAFAVALLTGEPVAPPRAFGIAALLHSHLMHVAEGRRPVGCCRAVALGRWRLHV